MENDKILQIPKSYFDNEIKKMNFLKDNFITWMGETEKYSHKWYFLKKLHNSAKARIRFYEKLLKKFDSI